MMVCYLLFSAGEIEVPRSRIEQPRHAEFHDCTQIPDGGQSIMVCRHRGHNRGVGPFLSFFVKDKILKNLNAV
jgi:hypothetical protein